MTDYKHKLSKFHDINVLKSPQDYPHSHHTHNPLYNC